MKYNFLLFCLLGLNLFWLSCANNTEEPAIDCSASGLSITVTNQVNSSCTSGGSITVEATGGTSPYRFSADDGGSFQSSTTLENLSAGVYTILVVDVNGCTSSVNTTLEAESGSISLSLASTDSDCGNDTGTITATVTGGTGPYTYSLNGGASQSDNVFNGVSNGSNTVSVTDSEGCDAERTIAISSGISLTGDIMPIITSNCAVTGCHNGSRSPDLRTTAGVIGSADRVRARTSAGTMPPTGRADLSQSNIDEIACWVEDGAPDN